MAPDSATVTGLRSKKTKRGKDKTTQTPPATNPVNTTRPVMKKDWKTCTDQCTEGIEHPFIEEQEGNSTESLLDLWPGLLRNMLSTVEDYNTETMLCLSLVNTTTQVLGSTNETLWKNAAHRDFNRTPELPYTSSYRIYQFLSRYRTLEGKYAVSRTALKQSGQLERDLHLLEIRFTTNLRFGISTWYPDAFGAVGEDEILFLEAEMAATNDPATMLTILPSERPTAAQCQYRFEDWTAEKCTLADFLSSNKASLHHNLTHLIEERCLVPLHLNSADRLHPRFLMEDGSWPSSLPKPGLYQCDANIKCRVVIHYCSKYFVISPAVRLHEYKNPSIQINIASAMVMTAEEQCRFELQIDEYVAFSTGLEGNPNRLTDWHELHLPKKWRRGGAPIPCKAWYCQVPAAGRRDLHMKVVVISESEFIILNEEVCSSFTRRSDIQ